MRYEIQNLRNRGMMRFRRISPCPKCGGKVKAKWELDGVIGGYRFYLVLFRCTVCGFAFEGGLLVCPRRASPATQHSRMEPHLQWE